MSKPFFIVFIFLIFCFSKAQVHSLQGKWILDKIVYQNGSPLEVNHPLYSTFMEYGFSGNNLSVNNYQRFKVTVDSETISTDFRIMNYKIENEHLTISEKGDDKVYHFLKLSDFLRRYPEFEPKEIIYNGKKVFGSNAVVKPEFGKFENFEEFLRINIPSYTSVSATNNFFKARFILTADNKVNDIEIVDGVSEKFDNQYKIALLRSEKLLKNTYGKDLLVEQTFNFFQMFSPYTTKEERQISGLIRKGDDFYDKNDFENAAAQYVKLLALNITPETTERFGYKLDQAFINSGVTLLATGQREKACESFIRVGGKTNFKVRNYLINFCN